MSTSPSPCTSTNATATNTTATNANPPGTATISAKPAPIIKVHSNHEVSRDFIVSVRVFGDGPVVREQAQKRVVDLLVSPPRLAVEERKAHQIHVH